MFLRLLRSFFASARKRFSHPYSGCFVLLFNQCGISQLNFKLETKTYFKISKTMRTTKSMRASYSHTSIFHSKRPKKNGPINKPYPSRIHFLQSQAMAVCKSLHPIFENPLPENQTLLESLTSSWTQNVKPVEQSLQLCTEGLGSESSDDVENENEKWEIKEGKVGIGSVKHVASRMSTKALPPPLSFMGRSGKGGVCFMSYREDGRFVLKEVRIRSREFLEARREDGRLKLQIVQPNEEDEDEEEDEEHDDVEAETPSSFVV